MRKNTFSAEIPAVAVFSALGEDGAVSAEARELAEHLGAEILQTPPDDGDALLLRLDENGLSLVRGDRSLRGDFTRLLPRARPENLARELLVRAAKIKDAAGRTPTAVDATAGMGEDAFLLAAAGFSVRLYERDAVIAALLRDALRRALEDPELAPIAERMSLCEADSLTALPRLETAPDVIVLDPMFPERTKSALIKKKFQLLQQLERPCTDENALLDAALAAQPRKLVVKRPLKGPFLAGRQPDYSIKGTTIRYDCIVLPRG